MKHHPAADAFPMMDGKRYGELRDDISTNGQRVPIVTCDGMILDGRNRFKAARELGIIPVVEQFDGDPWEFVWSLNGCRRDLVDDQRYLIWKYVHEQGAKFQAEKQRIADEANEKRSKATAKQHEVSNPRAGEKSGGRTECPTTKVEPGKAAKASASKTNAGAVARGDRLHNARPDLAEKVRKGEVKPAEAQRQMKREEVAGKVKALPKGKYVVLYADPPWAYSDAQGGSISDSYGAAEKHYPTMSLGELKALDIPSIAAADSVLFLWATCPLLEEALELSRAWGFKYKAQFVWDKVKHNMGHYNSVRHELLLVCTRGSCTPQNVKLFDSVQTIERTKKHSEKPEEFREIIETLYPNGGRIELFARQESKGWEAWGNEC